MKILRNLLFLIKSVLIVRFKRVSYGKNLDLYLSQILEINQFINNYDFCCILAEKKICISYQKLIAKIS